MVSWSFDLQDVLEGLYVVAEKHGIGVASLPRQLLRSDAGGGGAFELHQHEPPFLEERIVGDSLVSVVLVLPRIPAVPPRQLHALPFNFSLIVSHNISIILFEMST